MLLANKQNCPEPKSQEIAASYQNKGTLKTMKNIVKHRGITGLYTGFKLHLSKIPSSYGWRALAAMLIYWQCVIPSEQASTL